MRPLTRRERLCLGALAAAIVFAPILSVVADTVTGGPTAPGGAAGGDLAGNYPNPTVAKATLTGATTASGTASVDLSGASGAFKTPSGAATFGGSSNTFTNGIAVPTGQGIDASASGTLTLGVNTAGTIQIGTGNIGLTTLQIGTSGVTTAIAGPLTVGTISNVTSKSEHDFGAYNAATALGSATAFAQTIVTNASTLTSASTMVHDVAGAGTGTFVAKLCSDGVTCGGGNVYLTCTAGANCASAVAGRIDACTVTKSAVAAGTTLTWSVGTACGTTDPGVNVTAHMTTP